MLVSRTSTSAACGGNARARALAGAILCALVASGCQSNPEPPPLERTAESGTPSPTASPAEAAPTHPAQAKGTNEAAAKAFVRHWIDVLNYSGPAGDPEPLRRLSDPNCAACVAIADLIGEVHEAGGDIDGRGWSVRTVTVVAHRPRRAVVDARILVHPQRLRTSSTSAVKTYKGGPRLKTFWLSRNGSSWVVMRLDQPG
jgi:hypothetical protein